MPTYLQEARIFRSILCDLVSLKNYMKHWKS